MTKLESLSQYTFVSFYHSNNQNIYHVNIFDHPCCDVPRRSALVHAIINPSPEMRICRECKSTIGTLSRFCEDILGNDCQVAKDWARGKKVLARERVAKEQEAREIAWTRIPETKINAAKHDITHKGIRILSYTDSSHHMGHLLRYLDTYEAKKPRNFASLYWVEQVTSYTAWFHHTGGKRAYFHRPGKSEYLHSDEWEQKRQLVLDRDHSCCTKCGSDENIQVHHKTYEHFGNEPLEDLVSLCQQCHKALHQKMSFSSFCPAYPELT